jgi:hypothetical protein
MKYTLAIAALLGFATQESNAIEITHRNVPGVTFLQESESDSSDDEEENVQLAGDYFVPGFSGAIGAAAYARATPERFSSDTDDIFMRSMINSYALEAKDKEGLPTGAFWMDEFATKAAVSEVLCTHKKICGDELASYLSTYFSKAWGHFDVNRTGYVEVIKMPQLVRFLASDQYFQFMDPK